MDRFTPDEATRNHDPHELTHLPPKWWAPCLITALRRDGRALNLLPHRHEREVGGR